MYANAADKVLSIYELFELILLSLDTRTLLISQRKALFFKPEASGNSPEQRRRNPLLEDILWPLIECQARFGHFDDLTFDKLHADEINVRYGPVSHTYASWRRMLFQQPATSVIGVVGQEDYEQVPVLPNGDYLRLGVLYDFRDMAHRCQTGLFLAEGRRAQKNDIIDKQQAAIDTALQQCDMVFATGLRYKTDINSDVMLMKRLLKVLPDQGQLGASVLDSGGR